MFLIKYLNSILLHISFLRWPTRTKIGLSCYHSLGDPLAFLVGVFGEKARPLQLLVFSSTKLWSVHFYGKQMDRWINSDHTVKLASTLYSYCWQYIRSKSRFTKKRKILRYLRISDVISELYSFHWEGGGGSKKMHLFVPARFIRILNAISEVNGVLLKRRFNIIALYPNFDVISDMNCFLLKRNRCSKNAPTRSSILYPNLWRYIRSKLCLLFKMWYSGSRI